MPPTDSLSISDPERTIEFEFVRATENAALQAIHWLGRGEKEQADAAASDAIRGVLDLVDICGDVAIGEGIKDDAPGIFLGERLGTWKDGSPHFDIALDPIDGTTNLSNGSPNAIAVMAASQRAPGGGPALRHLPAFYAMKLAYGPAVVAAMRSGLEPIALDDPLAVTLPRVAEALGKRVTDVVVASLTRTRHDEIIQAVRKTGAALRLVSDGDVNLAVAPSLPDSGIDLFVGVGGSPEGVLAAAAIRALGGDMQLRMWPRDDDERAALLEEMDETELARVHRAGDLVTGESALFCATGISDSALLPGVKLVGRHAVTHRSSCACAAGRSGTSAPCTIWITRSSTCGRGPGTRTGRADRAAAGHPATRSLSRRRRSRITRRVELRAQSQPRRRTPRCHPA